MTALFCINDRFATDVMRVVIGAGRPVHGAISIVGFDDTDHAPQSLPALMVMEADKSSMGRRAVDVLDFRLSWPDAAPTVTTLVPRLVIRQSVAQVTSSPAHAADGMALTTPAGETDD